MPRRRSGNLPLTIVLLVIALAALVVGIIYLTQTVDNLPGFVPGGLSAKAVKARGPNHNFPHYTKRGIAALGFAVIMLACAYYASGLRKRMFNR